ncbi:hypothetical protein [uncultured Gammaproteobacteria bacterium]|nr:hypothetical protein [uncultured Gammaproteobacteria bacterium]
MNKFYQKTEKNKYSRNSTFIVDLHVTVTSKCSMVIEYNSEGV